MRLSPPLRLWLLPLTLTALLVACGGGNAPNTGSPSPVLPPRLGIENLDTFPAPNWMVFNRIQDNSGQFAVHDRGTLRLTNSGLGELHLRSIDLSPGWAFEPALKLPMTVAAGATLDLKPRFVATQDATLPARLYSGTLTITSDDPTSPSQQVQLAGIWQGASEIYTSSRQYSEPGLDLIRQAMGLDFALSTAADAAQPNKTNDLGSLVPINQYGAVKPQGDEVLSAYWVAADAAQPVTVLQVGAWSQQINGATINWYAKGSGTLKPLVQRGDNRAQMLFPAAPGPLGTQVPGGFKPGGAFGLNINGYAWSDPTLEDQSADRRNGCVNLCGQHIRFWPLKMGGAVVPNAYVLVVDFGGYNYDYNDEIYVLRNLKPAPVLLKVGATNQLHFGPDGSVWQPDRLNNGNVYFTPQTANDEPAQPYSGTVTNTADPGLYASYRGNVGNMPQNQRQLTFDVPINNGSYNVRLHFAELYHSGPGQRVFDVSVGGQVRLPALDIFAQSGGAGRALVQQLDNVTVTGGKLSVTLKASVDYPALSAIEILR
jgi:Malectin domain